MPFVCHALFFLFYFMSICFPISLHSFSLHIPHSGCLDCCKNAIPSFLSRTKGRQAGRQLHSQPGAFASNPLLAFCFHNGFSFEFLHHKATCDLRLCVCNVLFRNGDRTSSSSAVWKLKYIKWETLFFLIQAKQMAAKLANKFCCF